MMARQDYLGSGRSFEEHDRDHLQDLVSRGYRNCVRRTYFLRLAPKPDLDQPHILPPELRFCLDGELHVPSAEIFTKRWQALQENLIALIEPPQTEWFAAADVGFSFVGLSKLGIRQDLLEVFKRKSPAFDEGAHARAHRSLLDTSESDPARWAAPYGSSKSAEAFDVVVFIHVAADRMDRPYSAPHKLLLEVERCLISSLTNTECQLYQPLVGQWIETAAPLDEQGHEHFGYRDGITQPQYQSHENATKIPLSNGVREIHALGEVLLGHKRNEGDNIYGELGLSQRKQAHWEPSYRPSDDSAKAFFLNSSFAALRRIEQRTDVFEAWIEQQAIQHFPQDAADGWSSHQNQDDPYALRKAWIRAKLLGRTTGGLRLTPNMTWADFDVASNSNSKKPPEKANVQSTVGRLQEGGFHRRGPDGRPMAGDDSQGTGCPFSSHIRRMNPQDDPVSPFIHRPLLRRGLPYTDVTGYQQELVKGLAGLFICADLVEQFEHLVGVWAQQRVLGIPESSLCRDPLIGNHDDASPQNTLTLTAPDGRKIELKLAKSFVITRGCAYLWLPSKATISKLNEYT